MNEYAKKAQRLEDEILRQRMLRDAQAEGSPRHGHFQANIDSLTEQLLAWERDLPLLRDLDQEIEVLAARSTRVQNEARAAGGAWLRLAMISGALGAPLLLGCLTFSAQGWSLTISLILLVGAVIALLLGLGRRRAVEERQRDAGGQLWELQQQREALLSGSRK